MRARTFTAFTPNGMPHIAYDKSPCTVLIKLIILNEF
jgi:hypothetical protein